MSQKLNYKKNSWCKNCGEVKPKGLLCPDCGNKLRNNRRFKHEKNRNDS